MALPSHTSPTRADSRRLGSLLVPRLLVQLLQTTVKAVIFLSFTFPPSKMKVKALLCCGDIVVFRPETMGKAWAVHFANALISGVACKQARLIKQ